jgi:anaerobic selenocysteine-containing dehydrogenase
MTFGSGGEVREEIGRVVPMYAGIEALRDTGDAVQWGGERLCEGPNGPEFPTTDGRARFTPVRPPRPTVTRGDGSGQFRLATRRGKQFNTMVHATIDPLTGAARDAVFMAVEDVARLGLDEGAPVLVRSSHGELRARVHPAPMRPGNVQVHFPEGNVLVPAGRRDAGSDVPDYNALVDVVPL